MTVITKVLTLHHVLAEPRLAVGPQADNRVSPDALREGLEAHRDWDMVDYRRGLAPGRGHGRSLVLTIDDGYLDVLTEALPVLEAFDAPCIVFLVSGYLDRTVRPMESDVAWLAGRRPHGDADDFYQRQRRRLRRLGPARQLETMTQLAQQDNVAYPPPVEDLLLSWEQAAELARHPLVTIGSHTVSHPMLGRLDRRRAAHEAARSKRRLEDVLGKPVEYFAFPYGRNSLLTRRAVAAAGYRYAFTTRPALVGSVVDPMAVPRFTIDGPPGWGPLDAGCAPEATRSRAA